MRPPNLQARLRTFVPVLLLALSLSQSVVAVADCRLEPMDSEGQAERVTAAGERGEWTWQARAGEELRCDADGFEPLDLWCGEGCGGEVRVELLTARSVSLTLSRGTDEMMTPVTVEWRRLGAPGERTQLLATRKISFRGGTAEIPVASGDDRVLRLRAGESPSGSPQTVFVARDGAQPAAVEVAKPLPGGEVFGFLETPPDEAEPALLYLQGVTTPSFRAQLTLGAFGEFSLRGLAEGVYRPRAVYAGGAASVGPEVEVVAGETAELIPWPVEQPAAPALEDEDKLEDQEIAEAVATLTGRVTIADDEPASDLRIEAWPTDSEGRVDLSTEVVEADESGEEPPAAWTDAAGRFELALPAAGWWQLRFSTSSGFPVREQEVELEGGMNERDFDLGDAAIRVRVVRDDGEPLAETVHVELRENRGGDLVRTGSQAPSTEGDDMGHHAEILLLDLSFGQYRVSAYTDSGWASLEPARVLPSKDSPVVSATLVLRKSERVAIVRLPDGSPATDVLVALDRRQVFPGRPGEFPLTGANERSEIRIMPDPDYVPVCRRVGDLERLEIDLLSASAEALLVPAHDRMPPTGRYLGLLDGLPGSDCPMPIALQWQPFRDEHDRDRILIPGLVPGVYTLRPLRGEPRELVVPGPPVPLGAEVSAPGGTESKSKS